MNSRAACEYLIKKGFSIVSGGTDNHLFVVDMTNKGTDGTRIEALTTELSFAINKNTVPGDLKPLNPSGIRLGSPAMTTRGCKEADFVEIMKFLERATDIVNTMSKKAKSSKIKDFKETLQAELNNPEVAKLGADIKAFALQFPVPGGII